MKRFARLYTALDETTATNEKVAALVEYFASAAPADAAWAVHFLIGRRPKRLVSSPRLRRWAAEEAGIPAWLFEESYHAVGDLAETITLLLPPTQGSSELPLAYWVEQRLLRLQGEDEDAQREMMLESWRELGSRERFVWNKLITGSFRVGASQQLVTRALAQMSGVPEGVLSHRLMGTWDPTPEFFGRLTAADTRDADISRPYPFFLAYPLETGPATLGDPGAWIAEWKWDGIRAQLIRRAGRTFLWSRGGELLPWVDATPLPFAQLQRRIGRKNVGRKILDDVPVSLIGYDLLEESGSDIRSLQLRQRRDRLATVLR